MGRRVCAATRHPSRARATGRSVAGGFRRLAARADGGRGHRHHLPRRPPVAAGHPGAHPRPAQVAGARRAARPRSCSRGGWGGATYDVALRFLAEDPWERLAALREAVPNICLQMLLRGRNTVGYTPYPTRSPTLSSPRPPSTGIDIFRIFDALNNVDQMRPAIDAVRETGTAIAEVALCYTGDLLDPDEKLYTLDYYLVWPSRSWRPGRTSSRSRTWPGCCAPRPRPAGDGAAGAVRSAGAPAHPRHRRWTAGHPLAAVEAGVDAVDVASRPMAGTTSQPALSAIVAATGTPARHRSGPASGVRPRAVLGGAAQGLRAVRVRACLARPGASTPTRSPAVSCPTCVSRRSRSAWATGSRQIEDKYAAANRMLGGIVKVTPSSQGGRGPRTGWSAPTSTRLSSPPSRSRLGASRTR